MEAQALYIEGSEFTPEINFTLQGEFSISGISRPEDVSKFYEKPMSWLDTFKNKLLNHAENKYRFNKIHFVFKLKYFNSSSAKHILKMLDLIKGFESSGMEIDIDWYYDEADEQLLEDGQDLSDAVELPFNFIKMI
jgi:hypothetical protein